MIHRQIDIGLSELKQKLLMMAGHVEQAIEFATQAWRGRKAAHIEKVYDIEALVNQAHKNVDAQCVQLLALQQPLANELRLIVACLKINSDLERMTDLAVNITQNTEYYLRKNATISVDDLDEMSHEVRVMVNEVLDAFIQSNEKMAETVLHRDDRVDAYKNKIFQDCLTAMKANSQVVEEGLDIILIAKNLERIGDHATNIAEDIIFSVSGRDIRHAGATVDTASKG